MAYKKEFFKTEQQWLDARRIGGSSAAAVVGLNPWMSKQELWELLVGKAKPKAKKKSDVLDYGHKAEPIIRKLFAIDNPNLHVVSPKGYAMYIDLDRPYMTATVDGITIDKKTNKKGILEIKTHDVRKAGDMDEWNGNTLPKQYIIQVLHYLLVIDDAEYADFAVKIRFFSYDGSESKISKSEVRYYHIEREDVKAELDWLESNETAFYETYVLPRVRPPMPTKINTKF